jgi:SAM-dependent methyltransferase
MKESAEFDTHAKCYDEDLEDALSVSGEKKDYFAKGRIQWLHQCLNQLQYVPHAVMDFGCGTGSASRHLVQILGTDSMLGIDVSSKSLEIARQRESNERTQFVLANGYQPVGRIDLVFSNGTFHHIPVDERPFAIDFIFRSLRPGGLFALWENNPWNPGTRYIMRKCRFDEDAIPVSPIESRRLLKTGGFEVLKTDFLFIFPSVLSWLRGSEQYLCRLPLGAQYQILGRKPVGLASSPKTFSSP